MNTQCAVSEETGRSGGSLRARAKGAGRRAFTGMWRNRRRGKGGNKRPWKFRVGAQIIEAHSGHCKGQSLAIPRVAGQPARIGT